MTNKPLPKRSMKELLSRDPIGLLLRVYATEERFIPEREAMIREFIKRAEAATVVGLRVISRIDVLVWDNPEYNNEANQHRADCGKTYDALKDKFNNSSVKLEVHHLTTGDLFCSVLNRGIMIQAIHGCVYSIIASAEAASYMTSETMHKMIQAAADGARAIGVAIGELTESVKRGRLPNTYCMWHNATLAEVGMFDKYAEMPRREDEAPLSFGFEPGKGEVKYPNAGVEEILPLCRMFRDFGQCTAWVMPAGDGVQSYQMPDPSINPKEYQRQQNKWASKDARQVSLAERAGFKISCVEGALMEQYRTF